MATDDVEFAKRSVRYLRSHKLRPAEIKEALEDELDLSPKAAEDLLEAA